MHLFRKQAVRDYAAAAKAIPVIDYGRYFAGETRALERLAGEVAHACQNVGFFYALNHGVPDALIERAFAAARRFFALPLEERLGLKLNENNIGYLPLNASLQAASTVHQATRPNRNESFFISHDRGPDHPDVVAGKPLRGRNQWPADMPGLRADMMAYFHALGAMCDRMLPPFAVALGMPADFFAPYFVDEAHANLRYLHYPPPVIPGTFLINLGNIMRRWSNDRFLSTPHGVLNDSGTDRYSIAYFHSPNPDRVIECLPSCTGPDDPPRYPPAVYRDLVLEFYRANYFHQKGHRPGTATRATG